MVQWLARGFSAVVQWLARGFWVQTSWRLSPYTLHTYTLVLSRDFVQIMLTGYSELPIGVNGV